MDQTFTIEQTEAIRQCQRNVDITYAKLVATYGIAYADAEKAALDRSLSFCSLACEMNSTMMYWCMTHKIKKGEK